MHKNTIIAFDGPDNTGKSTQILRLRKRYASTNFVLTNLERPYGKSKEEILENGYRSTENLLKAINATQDLSIPQIVDRAHFTEYVYSIFRNGHSLEKVLELEDIIKMPEHFITVIFLDSAKNISSREDGLSNFDADNLEEIELLCERFLEIAKASKFKTIIINIDGKDADLVEEELHQKLESYK